MKLILILTLMTIKSIIITMIIIKLIIITLKIIRVTIIKLIIITMTIIKLIIIINAIQFFSLRVSRYGRYFGPGVDAEVLKVDAETRLVGIKLTTR